MSFTAEREDLLSTMPPVAVCLFSGAGGLAEGFRQAGFEIAAALDVDPAATSTFSRNHPEAKVITADIKDVHATDLYSGGVDVLVGGPSCQGFSTHGKRRADDPRNFLFREYLRLAREARPKWIVIENVKGMLTYNRGAFRQLITDGLRELGYDVESRLLLAANYGVPQLRERIFFIATRTGAPILFPRETRGSSTSRPWVTLRDALCDLPPLGLDGGEPISSYPAPPQSPYQRAARRGSRSLTLHEARRVSDHALSIVRKIPQGKGVRHLSEEELPARFQRMRTISNGSLRRDCTTLYYRLAWDRPAYTITCYFRNVSSGPFVHPEEDRALTCREAARLQSFPDAYEFDARSVPRQIGNAVPPLLAKAVAGTILASMRGRPGRSHRPTRQLALV